jgi:L-ascorbate metabolism protein UlaG (beta-lactamase superfamily)
MPTRLILLIAAVLVLVVLSGQAQGKLQTDTLSTSGGDLQITCVRHATLMFAYAGRVIHVDPISMYADYSTLPKADLILITHEHIDHLDPKALQATSTAATAVIVNPGAAKALPNATVMKNGETKTVTGMKIEAVSAYNAHHPKGNGNGYVLTFGDKRVYVAGDTENVPELKALKNIDVAFLPMSVPFTMAPEQVADLARAIHPKVLYPYHTRETNTAALTDLLKDEKGIEVRIRDMGSTPPAKKPSAH